MDSQAYWAKRQLEREARWHDLTTTELRKLKRYYVAAAADIERDVAALYAKYADENGLSMAAARKLIRGSEFKSWRMTLQEYVAASKADPKILRELNTLAMRSRISRLEALHARTLMATIDLAERLQEAADAHFARAYLDTYYGNLYDYHKTVGLYTPPNAVDAKRVESVLQTAWLGKNYSSRIWANRAKLARELQATILQAIHRGSSIQQLSKALSRRMEVAYSNAERLIRTELNAVENRASAAAMKAADFTHYQFMATLDRRTCARCGEHDGEVYKLSEMNQGENAPPLHARCRCTIVAYLEGIAKGERVAGRERLPEDVTYRQWRSGLADFTFDLQRFGAQRIPEGNYNLTIRRQVQNRHIEGTREYREYVNRLMEKNLMPSKISPDSDVQALVNEFHGKGIYDPNPKDGSAREKIDTRRIIGQYWDINLNKYVDTTWFMIVYSKRGTHIYPLRPQEV